ncbi:Bifunctional purple acid phosphatase 26 [Dichanthelium oligosanthes]|uniref:Purple acid phosphatase n=1 Tax=Dichanthelium oligosanthes TaxID=888268 RepID=A0A1E5VGY2_9POAL|nr:Bifunctional purple acid phosphatase 26 [Dichanthelium oligosanthes]
MRGWGLLVLSLHVLSCMVSGVASGRTSSYVRTEFPSTDIPLESEWFAIPKGYNAPQQVHITQGDYDGKAVIVSWVTPEEPGPSEVFYGKKEKQYDQKAEGTTTNYTFYDYKSGYIHHCVVDGLEYNTKYYYKIGSGDSAREFWFETPPAIDPDASYTFGIIGLSLLICVLSCLISTIPVSVVPGDLGQTFNSLSTLQHYEKTGGQTVLFLGDLSYADRYEHDDGIRWDSWGRLVERSTAYQPWIWNSGNHEIEYRPDLGETSTFKPYLHRYMTPYLASKSSSPMWYAVRRASAHIIVLSSYSPFGNMLFQLAFFCFCHAYSDMDFFNEAHYMEGESMRSAFEKWFVKYKVDLVFAGHVHAYERSYRISNVNYNITSGNRYPVPNKSAPVYITVGDGGNQEGLASRFYDPQPDYSAFREASYGHSILQLKNRTHAVYRWNRNDDGNHVPADTVVFHNQYWTSSTRRRRLKKNHFHLENLEDLISLF